MSAIVYSFCNAAARFLVSPAAVTIVSWGARAVVVIGGVAITCKGLMKLKDYAEDKIQELYDWVTDPSWSSYFSWSETPPDSSDRVNTVVSGQLFPRFSERECTEEEFNEATDAMVGTLTRVNEENSESVKKELEKFLGEYHGALERHEKLYFFETALSDLQSRDFFALQHCSATIDTEIDIQEGMGSIIKQPGDGNCLFHSLATAIRMRAGDLERSVGSASEDTSSDEDDDGASGGSSSLASDPGSSIGSDGYNEHLRGALTRELTPESLRAEVMDYLEGIQITENDEGYLDRILGEGREPDSDPEGYIRHLAWMSIEDINHGLTESYQSKKRSKETKKRDIENEKALRINQVQGKKQGKKIRKEYDKRIKELEQEIASLPPPALIEPTDLREYVARMRGNGAWGSTLEACVASYLYGVPVHIRAIATTPVIVEGEEVGQVQNLTRQGQNMNPSSSTAPRILLAQRRQNHYDIIIEGAASEVE